MGLRLKGYHKAPRSAIFQRVYFHASQKVVAGLARVQAFRNHIPTSGDVWRATLATLTSALAFQQRGDLGCAGQSLPSFHDIASLEHQKRRQCIGLELLSQSGVLIDVDFDDLSLVGTCGRFKTFQDLALRLTRFAPIGIKVDQNYPRSLLYNFVKLFRLTKRYQ